MNSLLELLKSLKPDESIRFIAGVHYLMATVRCHNYSVDVAVGHLELEQSPNKLLPLLERSLGEVRKEHATAFEEWKLKQLEKRLSAEE